MEQQVIHVSSKARLEQLKEQVRHFQTDAKAALDAARNDYEQARKAVQNLRAKSALRAFVQARLGGKATKSKVTAKSAVKKAVQSKAAK
jgi:hypothetical protein